MLLWGSNFGLSHIHCWSVHQLGSRLKYVNNHWLHCLKPWQPWCPQLQEVGAGSPWRSTDLFLEDHHEADTRVSDIVLSNYASTPTWTCGAHIQGPVRMNSNDLCDQVRFHFVCHFSFSSVFTDISRKFWSEKSRSDVLRPRTPHFYSSCCSCPYVKSGIFIADENKNMCLSHSLQWSFKT